MYNSMMYLKMGRGVDRGWVKKKSPLLLCMYICMIPTSYHSYKIYKRKESKGGACFLNI